MDPTELPLPEIFSDCAKTIIKVIGVGGAGCSAVGQMASSGMQGVTFIAADRYEHTLTRARFDQVVKLGPDAHSPAPNYQLGRWMAQESYVAVKDAIGDAHLIFIVAGMGGSIGTGAAPVIAHVAKETGAVTVGVVVRPMFIEGKKRNDMAGLGIAELCQHVDCLIVLPIDHLYRLAPNPKEVKLMDLFMQSDRIMGEAVVCICDIVTRQGIINLDFADVASVLRGSGMAAMGIGAASGEGRARAAAVQALASPLLESVSLSTARGILLNITVGPDFSLDEIIDAYSAILNEAHKDADVLFNVLLNEAMWDEVRVTLIATF